MKRKKDRRYERILAVLLFTLLAFLLTAGFEPVSAQTAPDKQRWDKVLAEARKEGKVVVVGPPGERIRQAMTEGFAKAFPDIAIEYGGGRTSELVTRLRTERAAGLYTVDVLIGGTSSANNSIKPMGASDAIEPVLILPEVTDLKSWREGKLEFSDPVTRLNLAFSVSVQPVLAYDPGQVKPQEINELPKLLDPKWKEKIAINDPSTRGAGNAANRWIFHSLGLEQATDYFRKLRAQAGAVTRDQRQQIEWVARGKYAMLFGPDLLTAQQLALSGLKFGVLPDLQDHGSSTTAGFGSLMLINRAPHANAAAVFINWLLGKEGQTAFSRASGYGSRRIDVPTDHLQDYSLPKPGVKYWAGYLDKYVVRPPEEEKAVKEIFGR